MEYYKRGHKHAFITLIKRGLFEAKQRKSSDGPISAKLNALLAAHYIAEGVALPPSEKRKAAEYLEEATDCLNEAEKRNNVPNQPEEVSIRKGKSGMIISCVFYCVFFIVFFIVRLNVCICTSSLYLYIHVPLYMYNVYYLPICSYVYLCICTMCSIHLYLSYFKRPSMYPSTLRRPSHVG